MAAVIKGIDINYICHVLHARPTASTPKSDEERLNCEDGTTDIEAWPPDIARATRIRTGRPTPSDRPQQHTGGGDSKCSNEGSRGGTNPLANDAGPRSETARHTDVLADYFAAIRAGNEDRLRALLAAGPLTVPSTTREGVTPLLAAIDAGRLRSVRVLLEAGADPNGYGVVGRTGPEWVGYGRAATGSSEIHGTPLQLAAARGKPGDGEAAGGDVWGRRGARAAAGGGLRRWKTKHEVAVRRARGAARRGRGRLSSSSGFTCRGSSCGGRRSTWLSSLSSGARSGYGGIVQSCLDAWLPGCGYFGGSRRICRGMSGISRDACLGLSVMALLRRCAGFLRLRGLQPCGYGMGYRSLRGLLVGGFDRLFSFLHTALVAAGAFFKDVTLENVWEGFVAFVHAVGVEGPRRLYHQDVGGNVGVLRRVFEMAILGSRQGSRICAEEAVGNTRQCVRLAWTRRTKGHDLDQPQEVLKSC
ncbi:hypothetical protein F4824DRAFT_506195 [Ustulina deusta]|nr:hypothetical protein F4824DRAFT_506195 [Ustulina deusta]